jgi:hypothetical protein
MQTLTLSRKSQHVIRETVRCLRKSNLVKTRSSYMDQGVHLKQQNWVHSGRLVVQPGRTVCLPRTWTPQWNKIMSTDILYALPNLWGMMNVLFICFSRSGMSLVTRNNLRTDRCCQSGDSWNYSWRQWKSISDGVQWRQSLWKEYSESPVLAWRLVSKVGHN